MSPHLNETVDNMLESPNSNLLATILTDHLYEHNRLDFKESYPDTPKLAKTILAMANSGGGVIVIGVKEDRENQTFIPAGVAEVRDEAVLNSKLEKYLPSDLQYSQTPIGIIDNEKKSLFAVISIADKPENLPFLSKKDSSEIGYGNMLVRRGTQSTRADKEEIDSVFQRRLIANNLNSSPEDFSNSVDKLKILYRSISKTKDYNAISSTFAAIKAIASVSNEHYPEEGFDEFISNCINSQKNVIRNSLH